MATQQVVEDWSLDREASRRMRDAASQITYLARLQEQALARNGRAFQAAAH